MVVLGVPHPTRPARSPTRKRIHCDGVGLDRICQPKRHDNQNQIANGICKGTKPDHASQTMQARPGNQGNQPTKPIRSDQPKPNPNPNPNRPGNQPKYNRYTIDIQLTKPKNVNKYLNIQIVNFCKKPDFCVMN